MGGMWTVYRSSFKPSVHEPNIIFMSLMQQKKKRTPWVVEEHGLKRVEKACTEICGEGKSRAVEMRRWERSKGQPPHWYLLCQRGSHDPVSGGSGVRERRLTDRTKRDLSCSILGWTFHPSFPPTPHCSPMTHPSLFFNRSPLHFARSLSTTQQPQPLSVPLAAALPPHHLLFHPWS